MVYIMRQQQERTQVSLLFKELIQLINTNSTSKNNNSASELRSVVMSKTPSMIRKKSKMPKPIKQIKNVQMQEECIPEQLQPKSFKKQSIKPGIKEQAKEDQTKLKQQIFDNYNKVMTYKIHQENSATQKLEIEVPVKKKKLSIMQNIALTIVPSKEETMKE